MGISALQNLFNFQKFCLTKKSFSSKDCFEGLINCKSNCCQFQKGTKFGHFDYVLNQSKWRKCFIEGIPEEQLFKVEAKFLSFGPDLTAADEAEAAVPVYSPNKSEPLSKAFETLLRRNLCAKH